MSATKASAFTLVSAEVIVDYGLGSPEDRAAAQAFLAAEAAELEARWRALPLRVRMWRTIRARIR